MTDYPGFRPILHRPWRIMTAAALILASSSVLLTAVLFVRVGSESSRTTEALCALRSDLQTRVDGSRAFLVKHPHGIPGISAKLIRDGIANQSRTVHALRHLSCD